MLGVRVLTGLQSIDGFLLTRQWYTVDGKQRLVFWLATDAGAVKLVVNNQESVFFVRQTDLKFVQNRLRDLELWRHAEIKLRGFNFESMLACYFTNQQQLHLAKGRLQEHIGVFEADVRPTDRYLMERFITGGLTVVGETSGEGKVLELHDGRFKPVDYRPNFSVASLDIETSYTENILYSIAVYIERPNTSIVRKVFMVGDETEASELDYLQYVSDEKTLIVLFLAWFSEQDADVIIGWSVVGFDLVFLQLRCDHLKIPFTLGRQKSIVQWRHKVTTIERGGEKNFALVPGRIVLDGIELLRTAFYSFESFSLENVAHELLGRGKLVHDVDQRASEIQVMFAQDKISLAKYNLEDCVLVSEIFSKTNLLQFAIQRSALTGLDMDRMGGSVAAFDFLYLPRLHRAGYVAPIVEDVSGVGSPGGYVLDSNPGLYEHVIVLDFKSLYPSIIRTFNIDPLAMVLGPGEDDAVDGFNGAVFSREQVLLPKIIEQLWAARDQAKRSNEGALSQAIKIIMNSFYGVLGTPGCRFFDPRLVSSITLRGHQILQKTRDLIQAKGFEVIYGDTDSVFVHLTNVKHQHEADQQGQQIMGYLNTWWKEHLSTELNVKSCLEVEYETHFTKFLMPTIRGSEKGSKKRYAGMLDDAGEQLVFKGLENVRSDWSRLAKDFQRELFRLIFLDMPFSDYVKQVVAEVYEGKHDDKLVLRKRLRRKLADYEKNIPPHVRAARFADQVRQERGLELLYQHGGWIEYIMTVSGAEPVAYIKSNVDYEFYVERQLAPIADAILNFKGSSLAALTDKQMGLF